jgi:hypothetical protein
MQKRLGARLHGEHRAQVERLDASDLYRLGGTQMTVASQSGSRPLKAFRLLDIPEDVRVAAAQSAVDWMTRSLAPKLGVGGHPLEAFKGVREAAEIMAVALRPSSTVYRVPQDAWDRMMKRSCR